MMKQLDSFYRQKEKDKPRRKAWEKFVSMGFPTKKVEAFRYVSLKKLFEADPFQEKKVEFLYDKVKNLVILPLHQAKSSYSPLLNKRDEIFLCEEKDPFFFLNHALYNQGLFIYVPPDVSFSKPLYLTSLLDCLSPLNMGHPKVEIFVGKGAQLKVITKLKTNGTHPFWLNSNFNVTVEENGSYSHLDMVDCFPHSWEFCSIQAELKRNSSLSYFCLNRGALVSRRHLRVSLEGENCQAYLSGAFLLSQALEGHTHVHVNHKAPHTRSHQFFRNVLSGNARSSFEGKIFVEKEAQKTEAYQLNNNLILSKRAAAFSKPNLEIFADDVKASHGATISKPNSNELFYLRSRGLSQKEGYRHIVKGFCLEPTENISFPFLRSRINGEIDAYLQ